MDESQRVVEGRRALRLGLPLGQSDYGTYLDQLLAEGRAHS
jgi:hypothetical protein